LLVITTERQEPMFNKVAATSVMLAACLLAGCNSSSSSNRNYESSKDAGGVHAGVTSGHVESGGSSSASQGWCRPDVVPVICVTVHLTGQVSVTGNGFTVAPAPPGATPSTTCADFAKGSDGELPLGAGLSIDNQSVKWDMDVTDYHGAGTYEPIDVSLTAGGHGYFAEAKSQTTVRVSPDFSRR
jgi:hypothetical protein